MAFVKASELINPETKESVGLTLVAVEYRSDTSLPQSQYGDEVMYHLEDVNGNELTFSQARNPRRENTVIAMCEALFDSPLGVPVTLVEIETKRSITGVTHYFREFNAGVGGAESSVMARYRAARELAEVKNGHVADDDVRARFRATNKTAPPASPPATEGNIDPDLIPF
jgi:hypothetical protein